MTEVPLSIISTDTPIEVLLFNNNLGRYNLCPAYQRSDFVWDIQTKSLLIESILLGLPIGTVYETLQDGKLEPIDGLQRLTTIFGFAGSRLKLRGLQFLQHLNGHNFASLPEAFKERFRAYPVKILRTPSTFQGQDIRPILFGRLNNGLGVNGAERVMGTHMGPGHTLIKSLARLLMANWPKAKQRQRRKRGQDDRAMAFAIMAQSLQFGHYEKGKGLELGFFSVPLRHGGQKYRDSWNSQVLSYLNKASDEERELIQQNFVRGLEIVQTVFADCCLTRYGAKQYSTVALIAQFYGTTVLQDRPLSWWVANRAAILQAYREVSARDFVPTHGRVNPQRDFLTDQLSLTHILSQFRAELLKIAGDPVAVQQSRALTASKCEPADPIPGGPLKPSYVSPEVTTRCLSGWSTAHSLRW